MDDPEFTRLLDLTERHAAGIPRLTAREKVFLTVVADVCDQTLGLPFARHVAAGQRDGVSVADLRILLRFVAFESGYHAALAAHERLAEIERELGLPATGPTPAAEDAAPVAPPAQVRALW